MRQPDLFPETSVITATPVRVTPGERHLLTLLLLLDGNQLTQCIHKYSRQSLRTALKKGFAKHTGLGTYEITPLGIFARSKHDRHSNEVAGQIF